MTSENLSEQSGTKPKRKPPKKSKIQSCQACRRQKARCEILEGENPDGIRRCHRCTALKATCSFESQPQPASSPEDSGSQPSTVDNSNSQPNPHPHPPPPDSPSSSSQDTSQTAASSFQTHTPERVLYQGVVGVSGSLQPQTHTPDRTLYQGMFGVPGSLKSHKLPPFISPSPSSALSLRGAAVPPFMWQFVPQPVDWSSPISALQELAKAPDVGPSSFVVHDESLEHILAPHQVEHLLAMFSMYYEPWLNFNLIRLGPGQRFLDLVCCTIASRYLDESTRYLVAPRLQNLTRDKIAEMAFNPKAYQSLEVIQGLISLALWAPICGLAAQGDGKMLIGMAVTMAMNMRLNEASAEAIMLRQSTSPLFPANASGYDVVLDKARIWIVLANSESLLCVGSGRPPVAKRSTYDMQLFPLTSPDTVEEGRDHRIRLFAELFNTTEEGLQVPLVGRDGLDQWYDVVSECLTSLDRLSRLVRPLAVVCLYDKFHFHILHTILLCCRELVLYQAIVKARKLVADEHAMDRQPPSSWFDEIQPRGVNVVPAFGKDVARNSEAVLTSALQCDPASLATSPDVFFSMLGFCGSLVVATKFFMMRRVGIDMPGSGDMLLEQTILAMGRASISEDHTPVRHANVMQNMLSAWHNTDKVALMAEAFQGGGGLSGAVDTAIFGRTGVQPNFPPPGAGLGSVIPGQPSISGHHMPDFWSEFLDNNPFPNFGHV